MPALALLTRNPVAAIAGILLAVMAAVLLVSRLQLANSRLIVEREKNSITQLQGAITNQNANLLAFQKEMATKIKVSQTALQAAKAAGAAAHSMLQELLARPLPAAPDEACKAADALILEFNQP